MEQHMKNTIQALVAFFSTIMKSVKQPQFTITSKNTLPPITTDIKYLYNITKTKNYEESMEDTTRQKTLCSLAELTL